MEGRFIESQKTYYDAMYSQQEYRAGLASQSEQLLPILRALNWAKERVSKDAEILDVGCGTGALLNLIQDKICDSWGFWGTDISEIAIIQGRSLFPTLDLTMVDASNLPSVKDNMLDIIISYGSLEHFYNPEKAIKEIGRILKPNGFFFLMMSGVNKMKDDNGAIKEIDVAPHTTDRTISFLRRPDGQPAEMDINRFPEMIKRGFGTVSDELIEIEDFDIPKQFNSRINYAPGNEGWDKAGQPQWNLMRSTWKDYFYKAGLNLWSESVISRFKPRHIHPFFFGEK